MDATVAALVGAFVGSCLSFLLLRPRLRMEARYDKFLQWCDSMIARMNEAGAALVEAREHPAEKNTERKRQIARTLIAYERFLTLCRVKEVYAEEPAIAPIQKALSSFEVLLNPLAVESIEEVDTAECEKRKDTCLKAFREATQELMKIARKHMGNRPLDGERGESLVQIARRILQSFLKTARRLVGLRAPKMERDTPEVAFAHRVLRPSWFYEMLSDDDERKKILYEVDS